MSAFGIESRMEAVAAFLSEGRAALVEREADVTIVKASQSAYGAM